MVSFKPILLSLALLFIIGAFLNLTIGSQVDVSSPSNDSVLAGFSNFVENGVLIDVPVLGNITFSPVTWLWLGFDSVTDFMVEQINLFTYLPDKLAIPIFVLIILAFGFVIIMIIKDLVPFT